MKAAYTVTLLPPHSFSNSSSSSSISNSNSNSNRSSSNSRGAMRNTDTDQEGEGKGHSHSISEVLALLNADPRLFRVFPCPHRHIVELCGSVKNVVALGMGFTDGLGMGPSTKVSSCISAGNVDARYCFQYSLYIPNYMT